jgi:hypothetical protein
VTGLRRGLALVRRGPDASVAVRVVLAVGVLLVIGLFVREMSGSASRGAGSDRIRPDTFSVILPAGGTLCETVGPLPDDAARASVLIGTYSRPMPSIDLRFLNAAHQVVASGHLPPGAPANQGYVMVPLHRTGPAISVATACLHVGGSAHYAIGGESGPVTPISAVVNGKQESGSISIFYYRAGSESWWQLLPTLDQRFAFGKATFFGSWTLPVMALLVIVVWIGAVRLLRRELT